MGFQARKSALVVVLKDVADLCASIFVSLGCADQQGRGRWQIEALLVNYLEHPVIAVEGVVKGGQLHAVEHLQVIVDVPPVVEQQNRAFQADQQNQGDDEPERLQAIRSVFEDVRVAETDIRSGE
ncbi:MAG: hypothetical protein ABW068_10375 [Candidatus Thiodiazotropha sp.]